MSILETFYILFKSDADKAAEGLGKVEDAADRTETALEGADDALKKAGLGAKTTATETAKISVAATQADATANRLANSFMNAARAAAAPLLAMVSLGAMFNTAVAHAEIVKGLSEVSHKLRSSIGDVDAFQRSVKAMGGDGSKALDALGKVGEKAFEAFTDRGSEARRDFRQWGVAFKDSKGGALGATEVMLNFARSIEKLTMAKKLERIAKLGIEDQTTIEMLIQGRTEMERQIEAQKALGVVTEDLARKTKDYHREVGILENYKSSLSSTITGMFLPAITKGLRALGEGFKWMLANRKLVEGFFIGVSAAVTAYFLPAMARAAIAVLAATWPFLLIAAAAAAIGAAFALAYEDVSAFFDGQPSLIGKLMNDYKWLGDGLRSMGEVWKAFKKVGGDALASLSEAWGPFKAALGVAWEATKAFLTNMVAGARELFAAYMNGIQPLIDAYSKLWSAFGDLASVAADRLKQAFDAIWPELTAGLGKAFDAVLPYIQAAMDKLVGMMRSAAGTIKEIWQAAIGWVAGIISSISDKIGAAANFFRRTSAGPANDNVPTLGAVTAGQTALGTANRATLGAATPAAIAGERKVSNSVTVGSVVVNTQATDAAGIARAASAALRKELSNTASAFDDGVAS